MISKFFKSENDRSKFQGIFINVLIRGLNLFGKFFLSIYIAKYSTNDSLLGSYTIFITTVTLGLYIVGLEFYAYSQREYLKNDSNQFASLVKNQIVFHIVSYCILLPIILFFSGSFVSKDVLLYFFIIFLLEHINQEIYRLLVVIKKPTIANLNYFLRSGVWIFFFIFITFFDKSKIHLPFILINWLIGQIMCLLFSIYFFKGMGWREAFKEKINWNWIGKGLAVCAIFFLSGIILKLIEYSERFFLQKMISEKSVGIYFFFYNIAFTPYIFFASVIVINYLPQLVASYQTTDKIKYALERNKFIKKSIIFISVFAPVTVLFFLFLTNYFITDSLYLDNRNIFWGLLLASLVMIISEIQYLELYIRHRDKQILLSFIFSFIICMGSNFFFISKYGVWGAVISKLIVSASLLFGRWIILKKIRTLESG